MSELQKNRLLEEFQQYLSQADLTPINTDTQPDLNTLLTELAGLKSEVKAEARQFKQTLDTLGSALTTVQADNSVLATELAAQVERGNQQHHEALRAVLLDIVDIYDRLSIGFNLLRAYNPVSSIFKHSQKQDIQFIENFQEGQAITLKRFEQFLQRQQVYVIDCVGKPLDPRTMSAVEIGRDEKLDNGMVLEELRRGFLMADQVLRLAEVKVNKK